jgi:hypothetical protein
LHHINNLSPNDIWINIGIAGHHTHAIGTTYLAKTVVDQHSGEQWTLETGVPVLLETQPIDPRSLFRGDYVRLNYTVSDLDLDVLSGEDEFRRHDDVYVVLC